MPTYLVAFRVAKTTPKKIGQFVTLWKRPQPSDAIAPFDISDGIAFIVVSAFDALHSGQFVFSQKVLVEKGIMSRHGAGGKRAIRVYPPWTKPLVQMARKTQKWQLQYFFPIQQDGIADSAVVRKLFDV